MNVSVSTHMSADGLVTCQVDFVDRTESATPTSHGAARETMKKLHDSLQVGSVLLLYLLPPF